MPDADTGRLAGLMHRHIAEAHPDTFLPSADQIRFNIGKSRMYGAGITTIFLLLPPREPE